MMDETKTCSYCAEEIKREAVVCPHCRKAQGSLTVDWITGSIVVLIVLLIMALVVI